MAEGPCCFLGAAVFPFFPRFLLLFLSRIQACMAAYRAPSPKPFQQPRRLINRLLSWSVVVWVQYSSYHSTSSKLFEPLSQTLLLFSSISIVLVYTLCREIDRLSDPHLAIFAQAYASHREEKVPRPRGS